MATKSEALSTKDIEELLDAVDQTMDRLKTLYEQYFMGIQKQAPAFLHTDVERKLRDLVQMNIRKTGLRFRLSTMQQKFGSYNAYWRRTLRQIENGTYIRNLAKIGREAARTGSEIPEEILAAMPKRMREQVVRDRDAALAIARRRKQLDDGVSDEGELDAGAQFEALSPPAAPDTDGAAMISEPSNLRREIKSQSGAHLLSDDDDVDFDQLFAAFQSDSEPAKGATQPIAKTQLMPFAGKPAPATQQITKMVPRMPPEARAPASDTEPDALFGFPDEHAEPTQRIPIGQQTTGIPRPTTTSMPRAQTGPVPIIAPSTPTQAVPRVSAESGVPLGPMPSSTTKSTPIPSALPTTTFKSGPIASPFAAPPKAESPPPTPSPTTTTAIPKIPATPRPAPSQQSRPNPIAPGSAAASGPVAVASMAGPFPRPEKPAAAPGAKPPAPRPIPQTPPPRPAAPLRPPPGMTDADVNALHAKYVQAKQMVGEKVDPSSKEKLLRTINQTAPKIMEQYKASGVDFTVVVKDNQVVIKAKPKT